MQEERTPAKIAKCPLLTCLHRRQNKVGERLSGCNRQTLRLGTSQLGPLLMRSHQTSPLAGASWLIFISSAFSTSLIRGRPKVMLFTAT